MKKIYNKFLIVSSIFLLVGGVYIYSSKDVNIGDIVPVASGASLVSSNGAAAPADTTAAMGAGISSDIAFLKTLVSLKKITLDTSFLSSLSFKSLKNNTVKIETIAPGRANPFAPMSTTQTVSTITTPTVVTNPASDITDKTANLNGSVNTAGTVSSSYFEYGTATAGGNNLIADAKMSLVGTFVKNITGLTPKTSYFYKACAKINNLASCGEIIPFTTN
jgi:hypothetical protein